MAVKTFTTGEVLTSADTNTYLANSGLVYITTATASSTSNTSINNCFSSTYDNYRIVVASYNGSTTNYPQFRMRAGGTDKTAADYYYSLGGFYTDGTASNTNGAAATFFENGIYTNSSGVEIATSIMDVFSPYRTQRTFFLTNATLYASKFGYRNGMVEVNDTASYDGFSLFPNTGTFSAVITVYGYRKA